MDCAKAIYRPRNARQSPLHALVRDHLAGLKQIYPDRFAERYGPWQPHWDKVLDAFLKCGDAHWGFARVRCTDCGDELILPFSCKARGFCPSCEAKRRAAWADHVLDHVLPDLPYRMIVFTVPKCLRGIFMRERALLGELCAVAYETTRDFLCAQFPRVEGVPYFVSSIQTAGDQANIHPHIHTIASSGIRDTQGVFHPAPEDLDFSPLEQLFRHAVLAMLRKKGRLSEEFRRRLLEWRNSGFSADASTSVAQGDRKGLERVVCYALRPALSLARLTYRPGSPTVVYRGTFNPSTGANFQVMDAKEFLALLLSHIPEPYEVRIRYFGAASSTARRGQDRPGQPESSRESDFVKPRRRTWARLIARVYAADPLTCPRCGARMRIIAFVQDSAVIEKILRHLGQWDPPRAPPPPAADEGRRIEYDEYCQDSDFAEGA